MKDKPDKGFFKEIAKKPENKNEKDAFTWKENVVNLPHSNSTLTSTPRRISKHVAVQPAKSNFVGEHAGHVKKRKGII